MLEKLDTHSGEIESFEKAKKELEEAKANFKTTIEKTTGDSVEELENANKAVSAAQNELDKQISALTKKLNEEDLAKFEEAKSVWEMRKKPYNQQTKTQLWQKQHVLPAKMQKMLLKKLKMLLPKSMTQQDKYAKI